MGHHILVIDDDPEEYFFLNEALKELSEDCEMVFRDGGGAAIEYLSDCEPSVLPEVVLLDINMPKMNGFKVLRLLKADEHTRGIPVFIFSTSRSYEDRIEASDLGAKGYYSKPFTLEGYRQVVSCVLKSIVGEPTRH